MKLTNTLKNFWTEEEGQSLSEYGLILALVAIVAIAGLTALGGKITEMFSKIAEKMVVGG